MLTLSKRAQNHKRLKQPSKATYLGGFKMFTLKKLLPTGKQKEQQAKRWLEQQGFTILAENYHCQGGEIDLIGLNPSASKSKLNSETSGNALTFFEVKYRKNHSYGHPAEMVNIKKQQHIILCAQRFLQKHPQYQDYAIQFDVITFSGNQTTPQWIQNAFEAF